MLCPNKFGETLQRQNLDSHITNDCPLPIIDCNFQHVGCEVRLPRKQMSVHLEEDVVSHLSLQATKYKKDMKKMEEVVSRLEEENKKIQQQVLKLTQDLQTQQIYTPLCPVEFTVTDFEQKRKDKEQWKSPPFYTHLKGYKLCLHVFANGLNSGKGTHVSSCINLIKGQFDNKLKWPFRGKYEIQLLDQEQEERHHRITVDYSKSGVGRAGERVTEGVECGIMYGIVKFISHGDLKPNYLKNDCLRFCITTIL